MPALDEKLIPIYEEVLRRNPGEQEFHQAVHEVLDSLGPVVGKHPEYADAEVIRRICEPERQIIFRVPWVDDQERVQITAGSGWSSTPRSGRTRVACASTPASTSES